MEKEKKKISKKTLIILGAVITIIAIICIVLLIINNSKLITAEEVIKALEQDGRTDYLQEGSIKIGSYIDYNYDKYTQMVCYSCVYSNDGASMNYGGMILVDKANKEYKNIITDTNVSALLFDLINKDKEANQKDIMIQIGDYFTNNGIEDFCYANINNAEKYVELGKNIGKVIGIKEARLAIDQELHTFDTMDNFTFFYRKEEIFPCYVGAETTDKEYMWSRYGITENAIGLWDRSAYNAMVYMYGEPYQYVTRYTVMEWNAEDDSVVGRYSDKEKAKEKLNVEEATDEPMAIDNTEETTEDTNIIQTNTTNTQVVNEVNEENTDNEEKENTKATDNTPTTSQTETETYNQRTDTETTKENTTNDDNYYSSSESDNNYSSNNDNDDNDDGGYTLDLYGNNTQDSTDTTDEDNTNSYILDIY